MYPYSVNNKRKKKKCLKKKKQSKRGDDFNSVWVTQKERCNPFSLKGGKVNFANENKRRRDKSQCTKVEYIPLKVIKGKHFVFEIAGLEYTRLNKRNAYVYYIE